jgi:phosphatidylglycerol:prolipoprotein diacylglycerol transferase
VQALLLIPWFKAEAWEIPIPGIDQTLPIQPFGVVVAIGVLLGAKVAERFGKDRGIHPAVVSEMVGYVVITAFIACYFLNAAWYRPEQFARLLADPTLLWKEYLGLSSYGGFVGAILGLLLWRWRRGYSMIAIGEAATFAFPFGWLFGRIGCFITHDHPGKKSDFFLAVDNYQFGTAESYGADGVAVYAARHDLGLYEVFWSAAVIALFLFLHKQKPVRRTGFYMALLPLLYAPVRFPLDYLRDDDATYVGLTPGQWGSIALLGVGAFVMWYIHTHPEPTLPKETRWPPEEEEGEKKSAPSPSTKKGSKKKKKAKA